MGAGKSTLGPLLAERLGRPFVSVDALVEERSARQSPSSSSEHGEAEFRSPRKRRPQLAALRHRPPAVVELGGGALGSAQTRAGTRRSTRSRSISRRRPRRRGSVSPAAAGRSRATPRRSARSTRSAGRCTRRPTRARSDLDGAVLAAAGIRFGSHRDVSASAVVADAHVAELHDVDGDAHRASRRDRQVA